MLQIHSYHLFCKLSCCYAEIASWAKMSSPMSLLDVRKFFKYFSRGSAFTPPHYLRGRYARRCKHKYVDKVFTYHSTRYLNLEYLTGLTNKFSYSFCQIPIKNLVAIFCRPNKGILNLIFGMTALTVFHAKYYIANC